MLRFVFFSLLLVYSCQIFESKEINEISDAQFSEIQDTDYTLVDVRTTQEYESQKDLRTLERAVYSESFQKAILTLDKRASIILYCRTQNRSTKTANFLKENGYKEITVLEGGITSWVKNGNDLEYNFTEKINSKED